MTVVAPTYQQRETELQLNTQEPSPTFGKRILNSNIEDIVYTVDNIVFLLLKDDENAKLSAKMKEIEEDRARLQKTTSIQQTQIEKQRALAEESAKKCDGLQLQVTALHKV